MNKIISLLHIASIAPRLAMLALPALVGCASTTANVEAPVVPYDVGTPGEQTLVLKQNPLNRFLLEPQKLAPLKLATQNQCSWVIDGRDGRYVSRDAAFKAADKLAEQLKLTATDLKKIEINVVEHCDATSSSRPDNGGVDSNRTIAARAKLGYDD